MGSVDSPLSDLVTIVVKAPNQQIADQTVQCHVNWTIKKLKNYLSEVYPSKPKLEDQKLIYSGKLLTDSTVLKDVLRTYEGQENHTVHLVCATKAQKIPPKTTTTSTLSAPSRPNINSNESFTTSPASITSQNVSLNSNSSVNSSNQSSFDYFNSNHFMPNNFDSRNFWTNSAAIANLNNMNQTQQYLYMQQMYAQYISQYMQMMGQSGFGYVPSAVPQSPSTTSQGSVNLNNNAIDRNQNQARDVQQGNNMDDEEARNRDWLDWFYVFSRIFVLFTIVYFYSTPLRLLAVLLIVCMFYLHQNMRIQYDQMNMNNNNNNNNVINNNEVNVNQNNGDGDNHGRVDGNAGAADVSSQRQDDTAPSAAENASNETPAPTPAVNEPVIAPVPQRLSAVSLTLLAIRTFFLSLVPDQPVL